MPTSWRGHPSHTLNWCSNPFFQNYFKSLEKKFKWKDVPLRIEINVPRAVRKQVVRRDHVADRGLVVHSVELWKNRTLKTTNKNAVGGLVSRSMTWWGVPSVKHFNKRSVRGRLLNDDYQTFAKFQIKWIQNLHNWNWKIFRNFQRKNMENWIPFGKFEDLQLKVRENVRLG